MFRTAKLTYHNDIKCYCFLLIRVEHPLRFILRLYKVIERLVFCRYKLVKVSVVKTLLVIAFNALKAVNLSVSLILVPVSLCVEISITWRSSIGAKSIGTEKSTRD